MTLLYGIAKGACFYRVSLWVVDGWSVAPRPRGGKVKVKRPVTEWSRNKSQFASFF